MRHLVLVALLCLTCPLHGQSPRVMVGGGMLSAYGATGLAGELAFDTPLNGRLRVGGDLLVARPLLEGSDFIHRTILSIGPTIGVRIPLLPRSLSATLDGTVQYTRLTVENYASVTEPGSVPDDRRIDGRSGISYGAHGFLSVTLGSRVDATLGLGYLYQSIYDNRSGDLLRVLFGLSLVMD